MFKNGYSFFEFVIVLGHIAFLVSLSFYFMGIYESALVHAELDRLYAVLIFMQRTAVFENRSVTVTFEPEKNRYIADRRYTLSRGVIFGVPDKIFGPPSHPSAPMQPPITWPGNCITFYPDGQNESMSAGALYLTNKRKTVVYALTSDASQIPHLRRYRHSGRWLLMKD